MCDQRPNGKWRGANLPDLNYRVTSRDSPVISGKMGRAELGLTSVFGGLSVREDDITGRVDE